jgi:hypothetical protein
VTTTGFVQDVTAHTLGSELTSDAAAGSFTLLVDDASDLDEYGANLVRVGGADPNAELVRVATISTPDDDDDLDELDYLGVGSAGISGGYGGAASWDTDSTDLGPAINPDTDADADGNFDFGPSTITLDPTTPLVHAWPSGTRVEMWDAGRAAPAVQWRALVRSDSDVNNDDAIDAVVAYPVVALLPEGIRDDDSAELVTLEDDTGEWVVVNVAGRQPEIQGQHIAAGSIQQPALGFTLSAGGVTVTISGTAPSTPNVGDIWYDANNDYRMNSWNGSTWAVTQFGVGAVSFNARALGAGLVSFAASAPASPLTNDLWYDTANGYRLNQYNGAAWVPAQFGTNAIAVGAITANLIAAGTITASQLAAGTITGDKIAASAITGDLIAANAITAGLIQAGAMDSMTINTGALTAGSVSAGSIGSTTIDSSVVTDTRYVLDTDDSSGALLVYAITGNQTATFTTPGTGTWTVPAGVTSVKVECWGAGGAGQGSRIDGSTYGSGSGGTGGEYARENGYPVTPLAVLNLRVGAGGAGQAGTIAPAPILGQSAGGQSSYFDIEHGGVTGNGGNGGWGGYNINGGSGSSDSIHYPGGANGHGNYAFAGAGGGSSAGTKQAGNPGANTAYGSATVSPGGTAPAGGGSGGAGGSGAVGAAGSAPGGGGGGGGSAVNSGVVRAGGNGANGKIVITYGGARVLVASIAGAAATDAYSNPYGIGLKLRHSEQTGVPGGYYRMATYSIALTSNVATTLGATTTLTPPGGLSDMGNPFLAAVFTVPLGWDGIYSVSFQADNLANATTRSWLAIRLNSQGTGPSANRIYQTSAGNNSGLAGPMQVTMDHIYLQAGDVFDFRLYQVTGASLTVTGLIIVVREG